MSLQGALVVTQAFTAVGLNNHGAGPAAPGRHAAKRCAREALRDSVRPGRADDAARPHVVDRSD